MRRLTTGMLSEKYVVRRFRRCANVIECTYTQWRTQEFFRGGGVQQIQLRIEDGEDGDLGAVAP